MSRKYRWTKMLVVFPLMLVVTMLFLDIPKIYYRYADRQLIKEICYSEYESTDPQNVEKFSQKAEMFLTYNSTVNPVYRERVSTLADEELYDIVLKLVQELNLLLGGNYKDVLEEMLIGYKETYGFTTRFVFAENYWDVGLLEFGLPEMGINGTILYDVDSYKIFWVEWWCSTEDDGNTELLDERPVLQYYEGVISHEITLIEKPGYVLVTPFPAEVVQSHLLEELYKFSEEMVEIEGN